MEIRRADSTMFGFDFQVNAAIILMLKNIKELKSLKLEGNHEDIELCYNDGEYILAQAKSVSDPINDFRNVLKNLKKALETLSEGEKEVSVKRLIFITNSRNPLHEKINVSVFEGESYREYSTLSENSKNLIDKYLKSIKNPLDTEKFVIQVLPFETDQREERYKIVKNKIDEFIVDLNIVSPGIGKKIMETWQNNIFKNGTNKDVDIKLTKSEIIWPLIYIITDISLCDDKILNIIDESMYEEVKHRYRELIEIYTERITFFTKVIFDYSVFKSERDRSQQFLDFIEKKWVDYKDDFPLSDENDELEKALIQIILYTILRNRISIKKIKEGVEL